MRWHRGTIISLLILTAILISAWGLLSARAWSDSPAVNTPICTAPLDQLWNNLRPNIVSDGSGGAIITWHDYRNGEWDIYARRVDSTGTPLWVADGIAICTATGLQQNPTLISDGSGGAIITWYDNRNGNNDIFAQKINGDGTTSWTGNGVPVCTDAGTQNNPTLTSDGSGGAIITWYDTRSYGIYAQRVNASGTPQWTANGVAICTAANPQEDPTITSDGSGGAIIAWRDSRNSATSVDIYAQKVNASGTPQWTANGVPVCTATGTQRNSPLVSDGSGGAIITWHDNRTTAYDIYAQRINSDSSMSWTDNGVAICTATGTQQFPSLIGDGSGGAIITWHDNRSGSYDIYVQKINGDSTTLWTDNGTAICSIAGTQVYPALVSDGSGGAVIAWHDNRNSGTSGTDIYARRVDASGTAQWTGNGVAISTATGTQQYPVLGGDGAGGAIITWQDQRNGNWDVYAQKIKSDGTLPVPPTVTAVNPALGDQGQTLTGVTITGTNFTGTTSVSFGSQVTVDSFTASSSTSIRADVTIDSTATLGARDVSVTTADGLATLASAFTIHSVLLPNFSADRTAVAAGQTVQFTDTSTGGVTPYSYQWDFDNSGSWDSTDQNPAYAYPSSGTYTVVLQITDSATNSVTETKVNYIVVSAALQADFTADRTAVAAGQTVQFTDTSNGGVAPLTYQWDFDNNGSWDSTDQNPAYAYPSSGTYTVVLRITDSATNSVTETKVNYIVVSAALQADFSADRTAVAAGQTVQFTDSSSGGVAPLTYQWDFDNNGSWDSADQNPAYAYPSAGTYTLVLRITDSATNSVTETKVNYIVVSAAPQADFTADRTTVVAGQTVHFTDISSGGVAPLTYQWDFDNNGSWDSTDQNPAYAYPSAGTYTVMLQITDSATNTDNETKTGYITVVAAPQADFTTDRTAVVVNQSVQFTDSSSGGVAPLAYQWDFENDGSWDSADQNPTHAYVSPGTYAVALRVTDSATNTDTEIKTGYIIVSAALQTDFSADRTAVVVNQSVQFTNLSSGGMAPLTYQWDFENDGSWDSADQNPTHAYPSPGSYGVALRITDSAANTDTEIKTGYIIVSAALQTDFSADRTAVVVNQSVQFTNLSSGGMAPLTYQWDFENDGSWDSADQNPTHAYPSPGSYGVALRITDSAANTDTEIKTGYITVSPLPPLAASVLVSPANGGTVAGTSVTFQWTPVDGAVNYKLIVNKTDNLYASGRKTSLMVGNVSSYVDSGYPANGTVYYWWVVAHDASGNHSDYAQVIANGRSFTNVAPPPPVYAGTPGLVSPDNGGTETGTSVTFQWTPVERAVNYKLIVNKTNNLYASGRKTSLMVGDVSSYVDSSYPANGTVYYWWVVAYDASGNHSDYAQVIANGRSFTNVAPPPPVYAGTPSLVSPDNGGTVAGTSGTFQWTPVDGAVNYKLIVNKTNNLYASGRKTSLMVGNVSSYVDSSYPANGTVYYWWVVAYDASGNHSDYAQVIASGRSFTNVA